MKNKKKRKHVVGVAAVVRDSTGRVLLIKTEEAGWELPGGKVEPGEDFAAALVREVREEACCEVEVGRLTGITSSVSRPLLTVLTFDGRHVSGEPRAGDDSIDAAWFTPNAAAKAITNPIERVRLADALDDSPGVAYRAYRSLPNDEHQPKKYELLLLHRC